MNILFARITVFEAEGFKTSKQLGWSKEEAVSVSMFCNQDFFFFFEGSPPLPAEVIVIDLGFHGSLGNGEVMSELILSHTPLHLTSADPLTRSWFFSFRSWQVFCQADLNQITV